MCPKKWVISTARCCIELISGQQLNKNHIDFLGDLSWSTLTTFACSGTTFATGIIAARLLGPNNFGKIAIILSISQFIQFFLLFGTDNSSIHAIIGSKDQEENKKNLSAPIYFLFFVSAIGLAISLLILLLPSNILKIDREFVIGCYGLALALSFKLLFDGLMRGMGYFKQQFIGRLIEAFFVPAIFLSLYFTNHHDYFSYILALILGALSCSIYFGYSLFPFFTKFDNKKLKEQISHGKIFFQGSISAALYVFLERLTIAKFMSFSNLGLFSVYLNSSSNLSNQLAQTIVNVFFPTAIKSQDKKGLISAVERLIAIAFFPLVLVFFVLIYAIIRLLGSAYHINLVDELLFVLLAVFQLINTIYTYLIAALSKQYYNKRNIIFTIANIANLIAFFFLIFFSLFTIKFVVLVCLCNVLVNIAFQKILINKINLQL